MISSTLYHQFPTINYNGQLITNLTVRLKFQDMVKNNLMVFYPYTISEGERADSIAHEYYSDASYAWLIYLANDIINPLEDWPKTTTQLDQLIINKYGSIAKAQQKVLYYRVDWQTDDSMLSVSGYNSLPSNLKKYWTPQYNSMKQVTHFQRSDVDWIIETNKIVQLQLTGNTTNLAIGEYVYQRPGGTITAQGEVCSKQASTINIKNVSGQFSTSDTISVFSDNTSYGTCTKATTISSAFREQQGDNPGMELNEESLWVPVSAYDYEMELNEAKKHIRLMDPSHINQVEENIRMLVAE